MLTTWETRYVVLAGLLAWVPLSLLLSWVVGRLLAWGQRGDEE